MSATAARNAVVLGLGKSGLSAARHLLETGWRVAVTDSRASPPGLAALQALGGEVRVRSGQLDLGLLDGAQLIVASPGLAPSEPIIVQARRRGLPVVGDVELFAQAVRAPVAGITGTNGKSTVTTLLGAMAARAGIRVRVGGNLGTPALDLLADAGTELFVLELSSFQLELVSSLQLRAGAVLNLSADHMDRYASIEEYARAKARIFANCAVPIINRDDARVCAMVPPGRFAVGFSLREDAGARFTLARRAAGDAVLTRDGQELIAMRELRIAGEHNAANALAALALGEALGIADDAALAALREFDGLAHRSQWVAEIAGVRYVNDSKGTNVGATLAAVAGMPGTLILIAGGDGKQQDFAPLAPAFHHKVRHCVLIGRDAAAIARVLTGVCTTEFCATLEEAVAAAARAARPGETVLLSPACASLDMFRDYAHRGEVFAQAVRGLAA